MDSTPAATCTVCGRVLATRYEYGSRLYCNAHLHRFAEDIRPVWRASVTALGFSILIIVGLVIVSQLSPDASDFARLLVSVAVALLPAGIWFLTLFRSGTRLPSGIPNSVIIIFVVSALIAAAIIIGLVSLRARQREDTVIGALWAILQPTLTMIVFTIFFVRTDAYQ